MIDLHIDEIHVAIIFGLISLIAGLLSWAINLKVSHDITEHNEGTLREIAANRDRVLADLADVRDKTGERLERLEHDFTEHRAGISEQILLVVNGRYARSELCKERQTACNERLDAFRQLVELHLTRLEGSLSRQIEDLKDKR